MRIVTIYTKSPCSNFGPVLDAHKRFHLTRALSIEKGQWEKPQWCIKGFGLSRDERELLDMEPYRWHGFINLTLGRIGIYYRPGQSLAHQYRNADSIREVPVWPLIKRMGRDAVRKRFATKRSGSDAAEI